MTKAYYRKYSGDFGYDLIEISPTGRYKTVNGVMCIQHEYTSTNFFLRRSQRTKWICEDNIYFETVEYFNCKNKT